MLPSYVVVRTFSWPQQSSSISRGSMRSPTQTVSYDAGWREYFAVLQMPAVTRRMTSVSPTAVPLAAAPVEPARTSSQGRTPRRRRRRELYNCALECVSGGDIPHQDMATTGWRHGRSSTNIRTVISSLPSKTGAPGRMLAAARKQATFLGSLAAALNIARHTSPRWVLSRSRLRARPKHEADFGNWPLKFLKRL
jgi:hypothetical protein